MTGKKIRIGIIGGGLMGRGIASVLSAGGCDVRVFDADPNVPRTAETIPEAVADTDWVVESIAEALEPKLMVLAEIERHAPVDAVISSNTSTFMPSTLSTTLAKPERFINTHFFRPADAVPLVEVIPSHVTARSVADRVHGWLNDLGKRPITLRQEIPGFVANRLQAAMQLEVYRLLDEGLVTPKDIDDSVIHGLALRMPILGIMAKADFTGLLLMQQGLKNRSYTPPEPRGKSETLDRLIADGRTGVMAGKGFFDWGGQTPEALFQERDRRLLALKQALRKIGPMEGT